MLKRERLLPFLFLIPCLAVIIAITIYPLVYSIYYSFHNIRLTGAEPIKFVGLSNFETLLSDPIFHNSVSLSVMFVALTVVIELLLGIGIATVLNSKVRGVTGVQTIITIPLVMTPVVVGIFWKMILHPQVGWLNQFLLLIGLPTQSWIGQANTAIYGTILMDVWEWTPFVVLIVLASMQAIPKEILEAVKISGASGFQQFRFITLPLIKQGLFVAALLRGIDAARIFDQIFVLTHGGPALSTET